MSNFEKIESGTDCVPFVKLYGVRGFDPDKVFDCGQCFRFLKLEGSRHETEWAGPAFGKFISVAKDGDTLTVYNSDEKDFGEIWLHYLGLDADYEAMDADIVSRSQTPALGNAVAYGNGIRILRQEAWETLCSFIISQNNNIPRIRGLVGALCRACGEKIDTTGMENHGAAGDIYSFPSAEKVNALGEEALKEMKMGFRAGYIASVAADVASGACDFSAVRSAPDTAAASMILQKLRGVGPKVAACALLFGFERIDAFPVDVWIKKVIAKYFPGDFKADILGPYAGLAQQYLFYYERYMGGEN